MTCPYCQKDPCEAGGIELCMVALTLALPPAPLCTRCEHVLCSSCDEPCCEFSCQHSDPEDDCSCPACFVEPIDFDRWQGELAGVEDSISGNVHLVEQAIGPWFPEKERRRRTRDDRMQAAEEMARETKKIVALSTAVLTVVENLIRNVAVGEVPEQPLQWVSNMTHELARRSEALRATLDPFRPFVSMRATTELCRRLREDKDDSEPEDRERAN